MCGFNKGRKEETNQPSTITLHILFLRPQMWGRSAWSQVWWWVFPSPSSSSSWSCGSSFGRKRKRSMRRRRLPMRSGRSSNASVCSVLTSVPNKLQKKQHKSLFHIKGAQTKCSYWKIQWHELLVYSHPLNFWRWKNGRRDLSESVFEDKEVVQGWALRATFVA